MDAVGFEPTIIGTYACGLEYLTHISMNYTEPDQRTLILTIFLNPSIKFDAQLIELNQQLYEMPITEDFDVFVQRYKGMNKKEVKVNNQKRRIDLKKEDLIRLTPENVRMYIGREIMFRTRNDFIFLSLIHISEPTRPY